MRLLSTTAGRSDRSPSLRNDERARDLQLNLTRDHWGIRRYMHAAMSCAWRTLASRGPVRWHDGPPQSATRPLAPSPIAPTAV
jgi:hypothetical protein